MVYFCCVNGCKREWYPDCSVSFHRMPKDESVAEKWKEIIPGKKNNTMSSEHVLQVRRLYKLIFRVHRALPPELRVLGDNYARDEFKRHKNCEPNEAKIFLNEWMDYAISLAKQMKPLNQAKRKEVGKYMDPVLLEHMTDEQLAQLYELHKAAADSTDTSSDITHSKNEC